MPKTTAGSRRRRSRSAAQAALESAVAQAVRFLIDTMQDPAEKTEIRLRCAAQVLDRAGLPQEAEAIEIRLEDPEGFAL